MASALLLRSRIGDTFETVVTGAADKGVFVRLLAPPGGRVVRGEAGLDVGDAVAGGHLAPYGHANDS